MATLQVCEDGSGDVTWKLRANNDQLVATGGKNRRTKVDPSLGIRFAKIISRDAEIVDCGG